MNVEKEQLLIELLRCEITQTPPQQEFYKELDDKMLEGIFNLAASHAVIPLVSDVLFKSKMLEGKTCESFYRQGLWMAVLQYQQQAAELNKICKIFEENKIYHIPLKGSFLRNYYPEPWLRTCCDIDILVKTEELDRAVDVLKKGGYSYQGKGSHDVSFFSENNVHIELHFNIIEEEYKMSKTNDLVSDVWNNSEPKDGHKYEYTMTNEMFYFYHIAHMTKHFLNGGCGLRPFVDIYILIHSVVLDRKKLNYLLKKGRILTFANMAEELSDVWFSKSSPTQLTDDMQNYIFRGGVYGNLENRIAMKQARTGGKLKEALSKIFLEYDIIKYHYPVLQKYKFLLPFFEIRRWCKLIFLKEHRKRSINHLSVNQTLSDELKKSTEKLLQKLEL